MAKRKTKRGFAAMPKEDQEEIAIRGGQASRDHQFASDSQ